MPETIYIAAPTYDGSRQDKNAQRLYINASQRFSTIVLPYSGSLLANAFNGAWCQAVNECKAEGARWLAMLHSDVLPPEFWLDALVDQAERFDADLMSAVIPIKDTRGMTSTAIAAADDPWLLFCRLTLKQTWHPEFPETFDIRGAAEALRKILPPPFRDRVPESRLLVNTGCFVCRIDRLAAGPVLPFFTIRDRLVKTSEGLWTPQCKPEDWSFSRMVADLGFSVYATRVLNLVHWGGVAYKSTGTFGQPYDTDWLPGEPEVDWKT